MIARTVGLHTAVRPGRERRIEARDVVGVGKLDRARVTEPCARYMETGPGDIQPPVVGTGRGVVDRDVFLVVDHAGVGLTGRRVEVRCRDGSASPRRPGLAVVE